MLAVRFIQALVLLVLLIHMPQTPRAEMQEKPAGSESKWIINDGSVPYLPAGSLTSLALALERGAPAVWLNLVLSSDDQVVLLPDTEIEEITDVAELYPDRSRPDGRYYTFDFTLEELRRLSHRQPANTQTVEHYQPLPKPHFSVISLSDALGFIDLAYQGVDKAPTLICTLKQGWLHQQEDKDLGSRVLEILDSHRANSGRITFFVASYDPEELQQLALKRAPAARGEIEFIQLVGTDDGKEVQRLEFGSYQPYNYDLLFTRVGIKLVSTYAAVIGLDAATIIDAAGSSVSRPRLLEDIKTLGMKSICCRIDTALLAAPGRDNGNNELFEYLLFTAGFDGIVTGEDARVRKWLMDRTSGPPTEQEQTIERLIDQIEESGIEPPDYFQSDATM